jgi:CBS domain containing-hemolysin-like protein
VIEESIDRVVGVVLKSELLTGIIKGHLSEKVAMFMRKVRFVPETVRADMLLQEFQETREHMVVVLDEYGGVSGVVTLEDVLEVLTGEIVDETDQNIDLQETARQQAKQILENVC